MVTNIQPCAHNRTEVVPLDHRIPVASTLNDLAPRYAYTTSLHLIDQQIKIVPNLSSSKAFQLFQVMDFDATSNGHSSAGVKVHHLISFLTNEGFNGTEG